MNLINRNCSTPSWNSRWNKEDNILQWVFIASVINHFMILLASKQFLGHLTIFNCSSLGKLVSPWFLSIFLWVQIMELPLIVRHWTPSPVEITCTKSGSAGELSTLWGSPLKERSWWIYFFLLFLMNCCKKQSFIRPPRKLSVCRWYPSAGRLKTLLIGSFSFSSTFFFLFTPEA